MYPQTTVMWADILIHAGEQLLLAARALACAAAIGLPLGALAATAPALRTPILAAAAVGRTVPSIALLTLLLPLLGVGSRPALVALGLLALPPIVVNADLAVRGVSAAALDAARGLGMTASQRFARITVPLALPLTVAGLRTASVEVLASATLATFIGAGGLGDDIVRALQTDDTPLLIASTVAVAALVFAAEWLFGRVLARAVVVT